MSESLCFLPPELSPAFSSGVNAAAPDAPPIWLYDECESTLTTAAVLARQHALPVWGSVLAARQTRGRGQLGRRWQSPAGNLYAALRLPDCPPFSASAAAPAVGALLAAMLATLGFDIRIKWPNDLVLVSPSESSSTFRKAGGILIEEREGSILAGIGLNVLHAPSDALMRTDRALPAGCLPAEALRACGFRSLLDVWRHTVSWMRSQPLDTLSRRWLILAERYLLNLGQPVTLVEDPDTPPLCGRLLGLAPSGGIRLETRHGIAVMTSGSLYYSTMDPD